MADRTRQAPSADRRGSHSTTPDRSSPLRVLVAADDPDLRQLIVGSLADRGYLATSVDSQDRALTHVRRARPDAFVVNWSSAASERVGFDGWVVRGVSGAALCSDVRSDPRTRDIRIVMMSDRTSEAEIREGFLSGADEFLTAPFDLEELHNVLASAPAEAT